MRVFPPMLWHSPVCRVVVVLLFRFVRTLGCQMFLYVRELFIKCCPQVNNTGSSSPSYRQHWLVHSALSVFWICAWYVHLVFCPDIVCLSWYSLNGWLEWCPLPKKSFYEMASARFARLRSKVRLNYLLVSVLIFKSTSADTSVWDPCEYDVALKQKVFWVYHKGRSFHATCKSSWRSPVLIPNLFCFV